MSSVTGAFVGPPKPMKSVKVVAMGAASEIDSFSDKANLQEPRQKGTFLSSALDMMHKASSIAGLMRMCGAGLLVFSLTLFLIQGIDATSDLQRYFLLLGQTTLLTLAGFAVGFLLKEPRGARVFFGLGLISIPANFAVFGAMIYSLLPMDNIVANYPDYASWHSSSINELIVAGIAGTVVLVPMSLFCFAVFARRSKYWLSASYLLSSASLLVPLRDSLSITLLSSIAAIIMVVLLANRRANSTLESTGEQRFAHALLFAPSVLLLARSAMLYSVDFHFTLALVICTYYLLRLGVIRNQKTSKWSNPVQLGSILTATVLSAMFTSLVTAQVAFINETVLFSLLLGALLVELSGMITSARMLSAMQIVWALLTVISLSLDYLMWNGPASVITSLSMAFLIMASGVLLRHVFVAVIGLFAIVGQVALNGSVLIASLLSSGWMGMAITGASIIILGSLIERYWPLIHLRFINRDISFSVDSDDFEVPVPTTLAEHDQPLDNLAVDNRPSAS